MDPRETHLQSNEAASASRPYILVTQRLSAGPPAQAHHVAT